MSKKGRVTPMTEAKTAAVAQIVQRILGKVSTGLLPRVTTRTTATRGTSTISIRGGRRGQIGK